VDVGDHRGGRRFEDGGEVPAYTVRDLLLRLEGKFDAYISTHEGRHASETANDLASRTDPMSTATGRMLTARIDANTRDIASLREDSEAHDVRFHRVDGALAVIGFVGFGTLLVVIARLLGVPLGAGG
jgi:hypothetical protein